MPTLLAHTEYTCLISNWAQLLNKLKRTLTCASLAWWMYSFWFQLYTFYCFYVVESRSSVFDKLLRALMGFDLSRNFKCDMEWMMLHDPLFQHISRGYSLGDLLHLTWYNRSSLFLFSFCFLLYIFVALFYCFLFKF